MPKEGYKVVKCLTHPFYTDEQVFLENFLPWRVYLLVLSTNKVFSISIFFLTNLYEPTLFKYINNFMIIFIQSCHRELLKLSTIPHFKSKFQNERFNVPELQL
jgi:hypothetical protein